LERRLNATAKATQLLDLEIKTALGSACKRRYRNTGTVPACTLVPSFFPAREDYNVYLPKGVLVLMVDLTVMSPEAFAEDGRAEVTLTAQEHKHADPTVRTFRPKAKVGTSEGVVELKQKIHLPEHFASCEVVVSILSGDDGARSNYKVKVHVGEY